MVYLFPLFNSDAGLLKVGIPKTWDESKKDLGYIRKAGIRQFISTYNRVKDLKGDELLWGDEIEYGIFHVEPGTKKIRLSLRAKEVSRRGVFRKYNTQIKMDCFEFSCNSGLAWYYFLTLIFWT